MQLDLPHRVAMGREDFFVSDANAAALRGIERWNDWPTSKMLLIGPEGSGKTHLAHVWAALSGARLVTAAHLTFDEVENLTDAPAIVVDDADVVAGDALAEEALFHLHNALAARSAPLLITSRQAPSRWGLRLPDLASRMAQAGLLKLSPPDDALLSAVMLKLCSDRDLAVQPATLTYAAARIERSFEAAGRFIEALDAAAIDGQRAPTLDLARHVLARLGPT